jgi:hypothetical protein
MLGRLCLAAVSVLALAACEPKTEEPALDGAPELEGAPVVTSDAPGELAGAPNVPGAILPGVINLVPPMDMQVIEDCESVVAADYTSPPDMVCLLFTQAEGPAADVHPPFQTAMNAAGWQFVRAAGNERYFERPTANADCADVAAVTLVTDRLEALVDHAKQVTPLPAGAVWQAYAIPNSTLEACGADRMKP